MSLEQWMEEMAKDNGFDPLTADTEGVYRMLCDETEVSVKDLGEGILSLLARLAVLPADLQDKVSEIALKFNHLFDKTEGGVLTLDAGSGSLMLHEAVAVHDSEELEAALERFVAKAERWQILFGRYIQMQSEGLAPVATPSQSAGAVPEERILANWLAV